MQESLSAAWASLTAPIGSVPLAPPQAWMPQQQGQPHCCPARYRGSRVSPTVALPRVVLEEIVARMDHADLAAIIEKQKALPRANPGSLQVGVFKISQRRASMQRRQCSLRSLLRH